MNTEKDLHYENMKDIYFDSKEIDFHYGKAKEELEISLKLYRLVVLYDVASEIPKINKRLKKAQSIYEKLYRVKFPNGEL